MNNNLSLNLQLVQASKQGDYPKAEWLLCQGASPDFTPHSGTSPIYTSLKKNNVDLFKLFITYKENGANINSLFFYACLKRHRIIVEILLTPLILPSFTKKAKDVTQEEHAKTEANLKKLNTIREIQALFFHQFKIDVNPAESRHTPPPIMIACGRLQDIRILALLILAGANVNIQTTHRLSFPYYVSSIITPSGWTPLMETCRSCRHLLIAKKLLKNGADVHAKNELGETPLMVACQNLSSQADSIAIIKALIKKGADPKTQSKNGMTPLMYALWSVPNILLFSTVRLLLETPNHINLSDNKGLTPLMYACIFRNERNTLLQKETASKKHIMKMLLGAGAEVNAADIEGKTALFHACRVDEDPQLLLILLEAGADPEIADAKNHPNFIKHNFPASKKRESPYLSPENGPKKIKLSSLD